MNCNKSEPIDEKNCLFPGDQKVNIGIMLYPGFDSLDVLGPNQVFFFLRSKGVKVMLVGEHMNQAVISMEDVPILPQVDYTTCPKLDVVFVPGGYGKGYNDLLRNDTDPFYDFLKKQAAQATLVTCVCTGAHIMARAGLLNGFKVTTHWAYKEALALFANVHVAEGYPRYKVDGNRVTGGGISSGIDEAIKIASMLKGDFAAQEVQLSMQYAPCPPFDSGDPDEAPKEVLELSASTKAGESLKKVVEEILAK